jgi:hypothetical protein
MGIASRRLAHAAVLTFFVAGALSAGCTTSWTEDNSCLAHGCGVHGRCELQGDGAVCVCEPGHTGERCTECAAGYEDKNLRGVCLPTCAAADVCGPHSGCTNDLGRPLCYCAAGYAMREGRCVWSGGPLDPDFFEPALGKWSVHGVATIHPDIPQELVRSSLGWARFAGNGGIVQSFDMPTYADAEPLALALRGAGPWGTVRGRYFVSFGGRLLDVQVPTPSNSRWSQRICLGDQAYGRRLELGIGARTFGVVRRGSWEDGFLDRAEIIPSADCAAPGEVKNGDFESGSWAGNDVSVERSTGLLSLTSLCGSFPSPPSMTTSVSVPEALERPALGFRIVDTLFIPAMSVTLDGVPIGSFRGTAKEAPASICLPRWTRGLAFDLGVTLTPCVDKGSVRLDDFVLFSDPSCADEAVIDGGFEQDALISPWHAADPETFRIVKDREGHSGSRYAELRSPGCLAATLSSSSLTAPTRADGVSGGLGLKLWHRFHPQPSGGPWPIVRVGQLVASIGPPALTSEWTPQVFCLIPGSWGHRVDFSVELPQQDFCSFAEAKLDLDDVTIDVDSTCPAD